MIDIFPKENLSIEELKRNISSSLEFVINQVKRLTILENSSETYMIISRIEHLKQSILDTPGPFLDYHQTLEIQDSILPLLISSNKDLERQISKFYNMCVFIARQSIDPQFQKSYDPFRLIRNNKERFENTLETLQKTLDEVDPINPNKKDLSALFITIISSIEAVEYPLLEQFKQVQKFFKNKLQFDLHDMFSLTRKYKDKHGQNQTDLRIIRNSLSHVNYKIIDDKNSIKVTFNEYSKKSIPKITMYYQDVLNLVINMKLLYGSILSIILWIAVFATLRKHFVKLKQCTKCKKGKLNVVYDQRGSNSLDVPEKFTSWQCNNCKTIFHDELLKND